MTDQHISLAAQLRRARESRGEVLRFRASRDGVLLLGRNLKPVGEPIPLTDPDSTDAQ